MDLPSLGIPWLMSVITPLYKMAVATNRIPVVANLVISNVPGPQMPLYLAGAEVKAYFPVSIVTHGLASISPSKAKRVARLRADRMQGRTVPKSAGVCRRTCRRRT